jgi:uncharacterized delta-60 repeat protein
VVRLDLGQNAEAVGVVVDGQGNYVVAGALAYTNVPPGPVTAGISNGVFLARYTPAGVLDPTFGTNGIAQYSTISGSTKTMFKALALDGSGNIVVGGDVSSAGTYGSLVARFTPTGALDSTFGGGNGWVSVTSNGVVNSCSLAIQPDGSILLGGAAVADSNGDKGFAVERFLSTGAIDTSFNGAGYVDYLFPNPNNVQAAYGVAVGPTGNIVLAGSHDTPTTLPVWGVVNIQ